MILIHKADEGLMGLLLWFGASQSDCEFIQSFAGEPSNLLLDSGQLCCSIDTMVNGTFTGILSSPPCCFHLHKTIHELLY